VYSTPYNGFVHDVEQDLNTPRPILAGGTAAINERDAMINLKGESATQLVDNYDSYPFIPGSFYSEVAATAAPEATKAYSGICYKHNDGRMFLIASAHGSGDATTPALMYVREKSATTWGVWLQTDKRAADSAAILAAEKVDKEGDTMSGSLTISYVSAPTTGYIYYGNAGKGLGFNGTDFGANAGFSATGNLITEDTVIAKNNIHTGYALAAGGTYYFGNNATGYLSLSAGRYTLAGGELSVASNILAAGQISTAGNVLRFGAGEFSSPNYLTFDGSNWTLTPGTLYVPGVSTPGLTVRYPGNVMIYQSAGSTHQGAGGSITIQAEGSAGYDPFITYYRPGGGFATNMGLLNTNRFGWGGWSAGSGVMYQFWSSLDFGAPVIQTRLVYVGDVDHGGGSAAVIEPYVGACVTGGSAPTVNWAIILRYRALQVRTPGGYYGTETA
jgi:hypothetical protein